MSYLLYKTFLKQWMGAFLISMLAIVFAIALLQLPRLLPLFTNNSGFGYILKNTYLLLPSLIVVCTPISLLIGIFAVYSRMNRENEWIALESCGVAPHKLTPLIVLIFAVFVIIMSVMSHFIVPYSCKKLEDSVVNLSNVMLSEKLLEGKITRINKNLSVYVKHKNGKKMSGIFIVQKNENSEKLIQANSGTIDSGHINLYQGTIEVLSSDQKETIKYHKITIDLTSFFGDFSAIDLFPKYKKKSSPKLLESMKSNKLSPYEKVKFTGEFNRRISSAVSLFLLGFFGVLLAGKKWPHRLSVAMAFISFIVLSFYLLERFGLILSEKEILPAWTGAWLPVPFFILILFVVYLRVRKI